jgi:hypothetical protein
MPLDYAADYAAWEAMPSGTATAPECFSLLTITPKDVLIDLAAVGRYAIAVLQDYPFTTPDTAAELAKDAALNQRKEWRSHIAQCRERIEASQRVAATDREIYEMSHVPEKVA